MDGGKQCDLSTKETSSSVSKPINFENIAGVSGLIRVPSTRASVSGENTVTWIWSSARGERRNLTVGVCVFGSAYELRTMGSGRRHARCESYEPSRMTTVD